MVLRLELIYLLELTRVKMVAKANRKLKYIFQIIHLEEKLFFQLSMRPFIALNILIFPSGNLKNAVHHWFGHSYR